METRNEKLLTLSGIWKNTGLDSDSVWKKVLTRRNREHAVRPGRSIKKLEVVSV